MSRTMMGAAHLALIALVAALLAIVPVAARSPGTASPAPSCDPPTTACASPTPASDIVWPPAEFTGGEPSLMLFTSTCGVWGRDPITLHGQGPAGTAVMVLTLTDYDSANFRWDGRVIGSSTAPNGTVAAIDQPADVTYDALTGDWILQAFWAQHVPASACTPASPSPI